MLTGKGGISPKPICSEDNAGMLMQELIKCFKAQVTQVQDTEYVINKLQKAIYWLCEVSKDKKNLLISGNAGSGKSTLAKALRQMLDKTPYALNTLCISAKKIGDIYKSREESDSWNRINTATCKILFIDDFGMEEDVVVQYGNKTQPMAMLIHNRYDNGLTTIITTNLTAEQMAKKYDDRIMDRLNGYARLPYNHISFRRTM